MGSDVDDFDWVRAQAETISYGTGPIVDHTLGSSGGTSIKLIYSGMVMSFIKLIHKFADNRYC